MKKYLLFAMVLFSLFFVSSKAATLTADNFGLNFSNQSLPFYKAYEPNSHITLAVNLYSYASQKEYNYLVFSVCTNGDFAKPEITNSGYNSYFDESSLLIYNTGKTCTITGTYTGTLFKVQMQVAKFSDFDEAGEFYAASNLVFQWWGTYTAFYRYYDPYLSNNDELSSLISSSDFNNNQKETNKKLDETNKKLDDVKGKQDEAEKTRKGILGKIGEVLSSIASLPKKIVEFLVDALKKLFVPTDEQLYEIVNDSKELSENFGFVGEAVAFFLNIFTGLLGMVNANGCIEMPAFKIGATSLFDEHIFWEARNVCLADNTILSANIDTIRTITSIAFVSLFLGFASRKFFSILSKSENEVNSE